jgi:hypothetical protein
MDQLMVQRITRYVLIIIPVLAGGSLFFYEWLVGFNILLGGAIGLFSVRSIAWAAGKFVGKPMGQVALMGLNFVKLFIIFLIMAALAIAGLVMPLPFVLSFTLVIGIILREGFLASRRPAQQ